MNIILSVPSEENIVKIVLWLNDKELMKYSEQRHEFHSVDSQLQYYKRMKQNGHLTGFIIEESTMLGTVAAHLDDDNSVADVGILIGSRHIGKGYGTRAWSLFCERLASISIRKIEAGCMAKNKAMIRVFEKNSMRLEGTRKYHFLTGKDQYDDMVLYGMLT